MTKELLSSILSKDEDDKVDMLIGSTAKHIQKNLPDDEAEECIQEIIDVINGYIRVAKRRRNPTAIVSWTGTSNTWTFWSKLLATNATPHADEFPNG